jgi:thiol-disulfide isomerase/thioredoxin
VVDKWLKGLTYLAVISLCCVRIHSYWDSYHAKPRLSAQALSARLIGARIDIKGTAAGEATRGTVAIAMTTSCLYCRASAPFYRELLMKVRGFAGRVRTVAVMPGSEDAAVHYLQDALLLKFDKVVQHLPGLDVAATPTLLVVDEQGVVRRAWIGLLKPPAENEVMAAVCGIAGLEGPRCEVR